MCNKNLNNNYFYIYKIKRIIMRDVLTLSPLYINIMILKS